MLFLVYLDSIPQKGKAIFTACSIWASNSESTVLRKTFYLVGVPVPEEVDGAVLASLNDCPAAGVVPLVTPHLHQPVGVLRLDQVHATGGVTLL